MLSVPVASQKSLWLSRPAVVSWACTCLGLGVGRSGRSCRPAALTTACQAAVCSADSQDTGATWICWDKGEAPRIGVVSTLGSTPTRGIGLRYLSRRPTGAAVSVIGYRWAAMASGSSWREATPSLG
ncbi:hypothetical protein STANM309S_04435 [Streptomyces tanashiensis]